MNTEIFKANLITVLSELGFEVIESISNNSIKAYFTVGAVSLPFLVKFSTEEEGELSDSDVKMFFAELNLIENELKGVKGLLIAYEKYSDAAFELASNLGINLTTYDDLLNSVIDFGPYLEEIIYSYENSNITEYVNQNVRNLNGEFVPMQTEIEKWIDSEDINILFLVGQSGIGKTSFSRNFAYNLACNYMGSGRGVPIPLYIELKNYRNTFSLSNLIVYHLFNEHNLHLRSFNAFAHLLSEGHFILILDGFDELVNDPESYEVKAFLSELFVMSKGKAKIMLTTNPDYILYNPNDATLDNLKPSISFDRFKTKTNYNILQLRPFKQEQIAEFVKNKTGADNKILVKSITNDANLREISKYPVLLELLMLIGIKKIKTKSELFEKYIEGWINDDNWMIHLTGEGRLNLVEELAWLLWTKNEVSINYLELPDYLSLHVKKEFKQKSDKDFLLIDINECPFIEQKGGMCSFSHNTFIDFFVAKRITKLIKKQNRIFLSGKYFSKNLVEFLCDIMGIKNVIDVFSDILNEPFDSVERGQCVLILYHLSKIIEENKASYKKDLYEELKIKLNFRDYDLKETSLPFARLSEAEFNGVSLSKSVLRNSSLFNVNFENADLSETILESADLSYANLNYSNLINSDLSFALLKNSDLKGAIFVESKMVEVNLINANCSNANFVQSNLHAALAINCNMSNVNMNKAELQNADFGSSNFDGAVFNETNLNHTLLPDSSFKNTVINRCNVWGIELTSSVFENSKLANLDMSTVSMAHSVLSNSEVTKVDFRLADLREISFEKVKFTEVNFDKADIRGCIFKNCTFDKKSTSSLKKAFGYNVKMLSNESEQENSKQ